MIIAQMILRIGVDPGINLLQVTFVIFGIDNYRKVLADIGAFVRSQRIVLLQAIQ